MINTPIEVFFLFRCDTDGLYQITSVTYNSLKEVLIDNCSMSEEYVKEKLFFNEEEALEALKKLNG